MSKVQIKQPSGITVTGCECLREWLPLVNQLAVKRGIIKQQIDATQGSYSTSVAASAGTHAGGGVMDVRQYSDVAIKLYREAGAAAWHRTPAQGFAHHGHLVLVDCPHLSAGAARQVTSYRVGRNGLASNSKDDGARVSPIRTWAQGVSWLKQQLGQSTPAPSPSPSGKVGIYQVTASKLNVRTGPSTANGVVGSLPKGWKVVVESVSNGWGRVHNGWISLAYATFSTTGTFTVAASPSLNARASASTGAKVTGSWAKGAVLKVTEVSGIWGKTSRGWVRMSYLR